MSLPAAGTLFAQRFLVERPIAEGGMGAIFRAVDTHTGQTVALKLLLAQSSPQDAERFAREARILGELRHPHIVAHVAHGVDEADQRYLAMEWLEGEDLAQRLRRGRLAVADAVAVIRGASAALAEAHQRGVVHRDLKPSNLFLPAGDPTRVVVLDFGIARRTLRAGPLTRTGVVVGTPEYMAPEQARGGHDIGPQADIFALGCVLHECLAGVPPYSGEHVAAVLVKVLFEEPPPIQSQRGGVPDALASLLARALRKDPRERFSHGQALYEAIRRLELPTDEVSESTAPTVAAQLTLTPQEQQIFSLAVAVPRTDEAMHATPTPSESGERLVRHGPVQQALREIGASVELLTDGTIVATVFPSASVTDQAFLAARCGLLLKERLADFEVAVATGRGLLRGQLPIGEAIDRAMQLLAGTSAAENVAAGVWLDELSENLLGGRFRIVREDGRALLLREQDPSSGEHVRRLLGQPTPCVGREQEMATLESVLSTCIHDSVARAVGVVAPPGMGKSRLRHEFLRSASLRFPELSILLGRAEIMNAGAAWGVLGQALRRACNLVGGEPESVQQERLRERIGRHLSEEAAVRVTTFLGELCGVRVASGANAGLDIARNDPRVMHDQVTLAVLDWLRAECQAGPVLLVLEDLHWGDALSVQLIEQALRELQELPLCVLALARPEVQEQFPTFWSSSALQVVPLRALSRRACERLANDVLRRALGGAVDADTVGRIVAQAAGHPLYLEELIRAVAEGRSDALPETILAMLVARMSQFDPAARQVLRAASVFGETFTREGLAALLGHESRLGAEDGTLAILVRAEVIEPHREGREAGQERYRFRHALVRDAAYSLLTDENRVAAHRLACAHLERAGGADPAVLGEHAHRGQAPELAARFYIEAGKQALARFDLDAAERHARRVVECGARDEQLGTARAIQSWTAYMRLDVEAGYAHAVEATGLLRPGSFWWTKAIGICFYSFFFLGRMEHANRLIPVFLQSEPDPDARVAHLEAGGILGIFFTIAGGRADCDRLVEKLTAVASGVDPLGHGYLLNTTCWRAYYHQADPFRALQDAQRAVALFRAHRERHWLGEGLFALGMALEGLGAVARAEEQLREALAVARSNHDSFYSTVIDLHMGFVLAAQPDADRQAEARRICDEYCDQPQLGPAVHGASHRIRAQVLLRAGDLESAEVAVRTALTSSAPLLPYYLAVIPVAVELFLRQGRPADARAVAEEGLRLVDAQGGTGATEVPLRLAVAQARLAAGDLEGGRSALREALAQLRLRAGTIDDPELQRSYLEIPVHRALFELARVHELL